METVLLTGGNGLIGQHIRQKLIEKGYNVAILSSSKKYNSNIQVYYWNIEKQEIEPEALLKADYIIHLAGANIGQKLWTKKRKQQIIGSRVNSAKLIFDTLQTLRCKPKAFITASAIGYYGSVTTEKIFSETDNPAPDFLGNVCCEWENAAARFEAIGIRTIKIRTGVVLTKTGGALAKIAFPVKLGIGSPIGSGKQYMPWVHIDDLCNIYIKAIEDVNMTGAYNAVAPEHVSNKEFMKSLTEALHKPFWFLNVPSIILKLTLGEMSLMILKGSRVSSEKIWEAGFKFQFPTLKSALSDLFSKR